MSVVTKSRGGKTRPTKHRESASKNTARQQLDNVCVSADSSPPSETSNESASTEPISAELIEQHDDGKSTSDEFGTTHHEDQTIIDQPQDAKDELYRTIHDYQTTMKLGLEADKDLQEGTRQTYGNWILLGRAFWTASNQAMKLAGTNDRVGRKYCKAINRWLKDIVMLRGKKKGALRSHLLWQIDNFDAVDEYFQNNPEERDALNHPSVIWRKFHKKRGLVLSLRSRLANSPMWRRWRQRLLS
jgi:hypothetical protein